VQQNHVVTAGSMIIYHILTLTFHSVSYGATRCVIKKVASTMRERLAWSGFVAKSQQKLCENSVTSVAGLKVLIAGRRTSIS
jgi:hypothetical protein